MVCILPWDSSTLANILPLDPFYLKKYHLSTANAISYLTERDNYNNYAISG